MQQSTPAQKVGQRADLRVEQPTAEYDSSPHHGLVASWVCRILLWSHRIQTLLATGLLQANSVREMLGLPTGTQAVSRVRITRLATRKAQSLASEARRRPNALKRNVDRLADLTGLNSVESDIVSFLVLLQTEVPLRELLQDEDACSTDRACAILAAALDQDLKAVRAALDGRGILARTQLVRMETEPHNFLGKCELMEGLCSALVANHRSVDDLLACFFEVAEVTPLDAADFPQLSLDLRIAIGYLANALAEGKVGANILLHGVPGAGKTEFARVLARSLGVDLYRVSSGADAESPRLRLGSYVLCQRFLERRNRALILFDEIEDVFSTDWDSKAPRTSKARINELLESNHVPAIWISNAVENIDPAYLRRFAFSIRFDGLPGDVRRRVLGKLTNGMPAQAEVATLLEECRDVTPSLASRVIGVMKALPPEEVEPVRVASRLLEQWGNLVGGQGPGKKARHQSHWPVSSAVAIDGDAERLVEQLAATQAPTCVLFYGPSGTGKTHLARLIADRRGQNLHEKRPAELLGMYVGQSERNVSNAFEKAASDGATLFIDEVDSLLYDRMRANQSWELSLVDEVLIDMEGFPGLLICATNIPHRLDTASLRRFVVKVRFEYLRDEQKVALMREIAVRRGLGEPSEAALEQLRGLRSVAVGDFTAVERRIELLGDNVTTAGFVQMLAAECAMRPASRSIGFLNH